MQVPQTEIIVTAAGVEITRKTVTPGDYIIGREPDCDVQIDVEMVSRKHAQLIVNFDHALVEDLGSRNGTFINDKLVTGAVRLWPNQKITIGAATIELRRLKTEWGIDHSLAPHLAVMHKVLPEEFLRDKKYEIGGIVAQGGMGAILNAREATTERTVAMKVMLDSTSPQSMARFITEAKITAQLEHPNIVPVHELSVDENEQVFYTMKFVKGVTLRDVLKKLREGNAETLEKYPLSALLIVFQKVCDALAFAHSKGVIHRDLKPENLMLGDYGEVLVLDWGLAKVLSKTERAQANGHVISRLASPPSEFVTMAGAVMGTPQYMAPEQARGEVEMLDARTDIYALGAILYHILTLRPPVAGRSVKEILEKVVGGDIVWPAKAVADASARRKPSQAADVQSEGSTADGGGAQKASLQHLPGGRVPESLDAVCRKAMALDYSARYQHVTELQRDITAYQGGFATGAESAGAWKQSTLLVKRHKALSIIVSTGLLLLAGVTAAFTLRVLHERNVAVVERARAEAQSQRAEKAAAEAEEERTKTVEANAGNLRHLHAASMADYAMAGQRIDKDHRWAEGLAHLARALDLDPKNPLPALRLYGTIVFAAPGNADLPLGQPMCHGDAVVSASFSPDGTRIVTASADKTARLWDGATGKALGEPMGHYGQVRSASFSPDGTRIVTTSSDDMATLRIVTTSSGNMATLWDAATAKPLGQAMPHEGRVVSASFSPDGTRILTASYDKTARQWDAATGKALGEPMRHEDGVFSASFSPDGTRIVSSCNDNAARLWDAATGKALGEPMRHELGIGAASFSPDGTSIVTICNDKTARLWDAATGKARGGPMRHKLGISAASFSPDGARILTASYDKTAQVWDAAPGKPLGNLLRHEGRISSASFSPDGTRVVTASWDKTARLWDRATGKPLGEPMRHESLVSSASFSPDGTRIVTSSLNTVRLWDAATGKRVGKQIEEAQVQRASFSPDGTRILTINGRYSARVWDAATGKPLSEPMRHEALIQSATFSPDGTHILTASTDKSARLWDAATGEPLGQPMRQKNTVASASFSPDGKRIVTASLDAAQLWDAATGKPLGEPMDRGQSASFSPDGTRIVTASLNTARLWDAATGKAIGEPIRHETWVRSASFSPDGTRIITMCNDKTARVWDAATGKALGEPLHHEGLVSLDWSASFSPDGTGIVTAGSDTTSRMWNVESMLHPPKEAPLWAPEWARAIAGLQFDADGVMQPMPAEERIKILRAPHEGGDAWSRLARWMATDPQERTIDADSPQTFRAIAERERDFAIREFIEPVIRFDIIGARSRILAERESLESALRYDPTVPLARLLLAGALMREDAAKPPNERDSSLPQRAAFLRDYDLKRLPDDPVLWERALRSLHDQKDDVRARRALQKLEILAPAKAAALRQEFAL
jgi:WD40 repeat protein/serine/threonine protein kinase